MKTLNKEVIQLLSQQELRPLDIFTKLFNGVTINATSPIFQTQYKSSDVYPIFRDGEVIGKYALLNGGIHMLKIYNKEFPIKQWEIEYMSMNS